MSDDDREDQIEALSRLLLNTDMPELQWWRADECAPEEVLAKVKEGPCLLVFIEDIEEE